MTFCIIQSSIVSHTHATPISTIYGCSCKYSGCWSEEWPPPASSCFLQEPLPTHPLSGMINKYGAKVRLHFKQELDQLWIGTKGTMKCWYMYCHHGNSINSDTILIVSDTVWTSSVRLLLPTHLRTWAVRRKAVLCRDLTNSNFHYFVLVQSALFRHILASEVSPPSLRWCSLWQALGPCRHLVNTLVCMKITHTLVLNSSKS